MGRDRRRARKNKKYLEYKKGFRDEFYFSMDDLSGFLDMPEGWLEFSQGVASAQIDPDPEDTNRNLEDYEANPELREILEIFEEGQRQHPINNHRVKGYLGIENDSPFYNPIPYSGMIGIDSGGVLTWENIHDIDVEPCRTLEYGISVRNGRV